MALLVAQNPWRNHQGGYGGLSLPKLMQGLKSIRHGFLHPLCRHSSDRPTPPPGIDPIQPQPTPFDPMLRASAQGCIQQPKHPDILDRADT